MGLMSSSLSARSWRCCATLPADATSDIVCCASCGLRLQPGSTSVPTVPRADMPEVCVDTSALSSARLRGRRVHWRGPPADRRADEEILTSDYVVRSN